MYSVVVLFTYACVFKCLKPFSLRIFQSLERLENLPAQLWVLRTNVCAAGVIIVVVEAVKGEEVREEEEDNKQREVEVEVTRLAIDSVVNVRNVAAAVETPHRRLLRRLRLFIFLK